MSRPRMKRARWTWKKKPSRKLWRTGQVILRGDDMKAFRLEIFRRAEGRCEIEEDGVRCNIYAPWDGFGHGELSHKIHKGRGGSDSPDNVSWSCVGHHRKLHLGPQWSRKEVA